MRKIKGKNILITGGDGFIAGTLSEYFRSTENNVYILRKPRQESCLTKDTNIYCDIQNYECLRENLSKVDLDYIYHFAAISDSNKADLNVKMTFDVNIQGTWNLLEIAKEKKITKFFLASSMAVNRKKPDADLSTGIININNASSYIVSKICAENASFIYNKLFNLPIVILRIANVFGEGDLNLSRLIPSTVVSLLQNSSPKIKSSGDTYLDLVYIEDFLDAVLYATEKNVFLSKNIGIVNISNGTRYTIANIVEKIVRISGQDHLYPKKLEQNNNVEFSNQVYKPPFNNFNWRPKYDIDVALEKTYLWYKNYYIRKQLI